MTKLTAEQAAEVIRRYDDGEPLRAIAESMNISYGTVHRVIKASPVEFRPRGGSHA